MNSSDLLIKNIDLAVLNSPAMVQSDIMSTNSGNKKRKEMEGREEGSFVSKRARIRATLPHQINIFRFHLPDSDCDDFNDFESDVEIHGSEDEVDVEIDESDVEINESEDEADVEIEESEDEADIESNKSEDEVCVEIDESENEGADETELGSEFEEV